MQSAEVRTPQGGLAAPITSAQRLRNAPPKPRPTSLTLFHPGRSQGGARKNLPSAAQIGGSKGHSSCVSTHVGSHTRPLYRSVALVCTLQAQTARGKRAAGCRDNPNPRIIEGHTMRRRNTATATLGILVRIVAVYGVFWLMQETSALALAWWNQETPQWMWPSPTTAPTVTTTTGACRIAPRRQRRQTASMRQQPRPFRDSSRISRGPGVSRLPLVFLPRVAISKGNTTACCGCCVSLGLTPKSVDETQQDGCV